MDGSAWISGKNEWAGRKTDRPIADGSSLGMLWPMAKLDFPLYHGTCTLFVERGRERGQAAPWSRGRLNMAETSESSHASQQGAT
jgi:hypothetical protein